MRKFSVILCGSGDYAGKKPDYAEISEINEVVPFVFPTNKIYVNILPSILVLYDMVELLLLFVGRYFFVFHSFRC